MEADAPLDFALFQLSPRRSRCELVVSGNGRTERIASGSVKPFVAHLRAAEEQAAMQPPPPVIRLQVEGRAAWFSKGTLERFVRFVSTPEVLDMANTFDAEMSQLEGARKIYSGGAGDATSGGAAEKDTAVAAAADITKKELLKAIDVRLSALKQDLATACARASSAGFNLDNVSELLLFAEHFGANRLSEACTKFMSLCQQRPDLIPQHSPSAHSLHWKGFDDGNVRDSSSSDMSIDEPDVDLARPNKKTLAGGSNNSHTHRPSNSQRSTEGPSEHVREQQPKPTVQQVVEKQEKETDAPAPMPAGGGNSRRLSVQDRINMFESKQKEQTSSSGNSNSTGTGKVIPGKGEHRRVLSSTSMEKSVLRRWSGASDMSIDLSNNDSSGFNDRKETGASVETLTSANLEGNSNIRADREASELKDSVASRSWSCQKESSNDISIDCTATNTCSSSTLITTSSSSSVVTAIQKQSGDSTEENMVITSSIECASSFEKDQGVNQGHSNMGKSEHTVANAPTRTRVRTSPKLVEEASAKDKATFPSPSPDVHVQMVEETLPAAYDIPVAREQMPQRDNTRRTRFQTKEIHAAADGARIKDQPSRIFGKVSGGVDPRSKTPSDSQMNVRASSGRGGVASTESEVHAVSLQRKNQLKKAEDIRRKVAAASETPCLLDRSGLQGTNLSRQSSTSEQELIFQGDKLINDGNGGPVFSERKFTELIQMPDLPKGTNSEQARATRPIKGNHDLNDELQMKADELEKLFAAHKLRVQGEPVTSSRRGKTTDVQVDNPPKASEVKPASVLPDQVFTKQIAKENTDNDFDANELLKMVDNQEYNSSIQQKLSILSLEETRGKFYEQYMQKRNVKLRENWKLQREQKEATLKAMHDSLEQSKAEMHAKFPRSANIQDSTCASRGAKTISPFQSATKDKGQGVDCLLVEDEMNSDYLSGDGSSRSADSRKQFSNRVSSTNRASMAPAPRPSSRTASSGDANRRTPLENPLAQSVPNFSDLRKENTKSSSGISRGTRAQPKSFSRSKSIIEESKSIVKEDRSRKSQSMRKSLNTAELKDMSSLNEDIFNRAPSIISKDQAEGAFAYNIHKSGAPKSFLTKGNGVRPIVGITGLQASVVSNIFLNGEDDELVDQQEDSPDDAKEHEEYESVEENLRESDVPADSESENPRMSHDFGNSDDPVSENGDIPHLSEAATLTGTKFNAFAGDMRAVSGELPAPWSSRLPHLFPYANDNSDGDAFLDSPTGSPSPWNSHQLDQIMDADVSRMRKKWGSAQMPVIGANPAQQSRKDVTKGFKKLLKFGRKNRGVDGLVNDWVSASTASECDDDMEDSRDLPVGSSEDFRKSRMGSVSSYDGFVENDILAEQVQSLRSSIPNPPANFRLREDHLTGSSLKAPRSFFSLSTFRSKGSDARLR